MSILASILRLPYGGVNEQMLIIASKMVARIIACGGIFSAEDAAEKIAAGASLFQVYTGLIYRGPRLIAEIANFSR